MPSASAVNGLGEYPEWTISGATGSVSVPTVPGFPTAAIATDNDVDIEDGDDEFLNGTTPFGAYFGSSENKRFLNLDSDGEGTYVTTFTFEHAAPANGWGFTLADTDVDQVTIEATDAAGTPLDVSSWFRSVFNFCNGAPLPPDCGSVRTDLPTWVSPTLTGPDEPTQGASGWFIPTANVKTLKLSFSGISEDPGSYRFWMAVNPAPTATTHAATAISEGKASVSGTVNVHGTNSSALSIKYAKDHATIAAGGGTAATISPTSATGLSDTLVSAHLKNLTPNTTYYYRTSVTTTQGSAHGAIESFTTLPSALTIASGKVKGKGTKKTVRLHGHAKKKSGKVRIYRAKTKHGLAQLVATVNAKDYRWAKTVSLGGHSKAFFCAREGSAVTDPIRVPAKVQAATTRGDVVRFRC